jgi:hypothetical protein
MTEVIIKKFMTIGGKYFSVIGLTIVNICAIITYIR